METSERNDDRFDRLVEGELDDDDRRRLLCELDADAQGWKRLALAFLEAQEWRAALAGVDRVPPTTAVAHRRTGARAARFAATLALLLAAFGSGWWLKPAQATVVATEPTSTVETTGPARIVGQVVWSGSETLVQAGVPMQRIALVENPDRDGAWLAATPVLASDYSKAKLERMGCRLIERRDVIPMELADGRRLALLVEDVRLGVKGRTPNL